MSLFLALCLWKGILKNNAKLKLLLPRINYRLCLVTLIKVGCRTTHISVTDQGTYASHLLTIIFPIFIPESSTGTLYNTFE